LGSRRTSCELSNERIGLKKTRCVDPCSFDAGFGSALIDKNLQKTTSISADETWRFEACRLRYKLEPGWRANA
jgi:hypothetical protein